MKVLITGANGLVGQHLVSHLLQAKKQVVALGKGPTRLPIAEKKGLRYYEADFSDYGQINEVIKSEHPQMIVHAGAMTQVDLCETQPDTCRQINVEGTANVLKLAEEVGAYVLFMSTDFVFDGTKGNYTEQDELRAVNWYGRTKIMAEELVANAPVHWCIVRTCLVYGNTLGGTRPNIITWVKDNLQKSQTIKVVDDQLRTPTYAVDLARGLELILNQRAEGIFHLAGEDWLSPFDIALEVASHFSLDRNLIQRVNASTFSQAAVRPKLTGLSIEKAKAQLGFLPTPFARSLVEIFHSGM